MSAIPNFRPIFWELWTARISKSQASNLTTPSCMITDVTHVVTLLKVWPGEMSGCSQVGSCVGTWQAITCIYLIWLFCCWLQWLVNNGCYIRISPWTYSFVLAGLQIWGMPPWCSFGPPKVWPVKSHDFRGMKIKPPWGKILILWIKNRSQ